MELLMTQKTFDIMPQTSCVEGLINACIASLPHLPEPEKGAMIKALEEFETFTVPTAWSAEDVVEEIDDQQLTQDEKIRAIAYFSESYECKQIDWDKIEQCARDVLSERDDANAEDRANLADHCSTHML